jgi:hypothetical protein
MPKKKKNSVKEAEANSSAWNEKYPEYTHSNLNTLNVMKAPDMGFVYVDTNHPAVHVLRINKDILGLDVDSIPLLDGRFVKMTSPLFENICCTIRSKVMTWI